MSCDCKANRQIYELGRRYGTTVRRTRKDMIKGGVWKAVQYFLLALFSVAAAPVLFAIVFWKHVVEGERSIHIGRMIGLKKEKNVG